MTRVYCTNKLKSFIGKVETDLPDDSNNLTINDWNAHLFFIERKKCLIFVNSLTHYSVFIPAVLKKDLKQINNLFFNRLTEQLINDGVIHQQNEIETIWKPTDLCFYKTNNNKSAIGRINYLVDSFNIHNIYKYESFEFMDVVYENGLLNQTPFELKREGSKHRTNSIKEMKKIKNAKS